MRQVNTVERNMVATGSYVVLLVMLVAGMEVAAFSLTGELSVSGPLNIIAGAVEAVCQCVSNQLDKVVDVICDAVVECQRACTRAFV